MPQTVRDVMTPHPITVQASTVVADAACAMRDAGVGDVIVVEGTRLYGIVTDRDIVVRAVAERRDAESARIGDICSENLACVAPSDSVEDAARMMSESAVRRLPVIEGGELVGIVALGDLAVERDRRSVLGHISAAVPNR